MSVKRLNREVDSAEFSEWMAYSVLEPFGPEREDHRAGMIAALIANVNRDPKQRADPYDVDDFFPQYQEENSLNVVARDAPASGLEAKMAAWVGKMNAADAADKKGSRSELRPKR